MPETASTWTDADAVALRQFLDTNPNFLRELAKHKPQRTRETTMEAAALQGARRDGAEQILEGIAKMAGADGVVEKSPYIEEPQS